MSNCTVAVFASRGATVAFVIRSVLGWSGQPACVAPGPNSRPQAIATAGL
jgi:hypothetical protein